MEKREIQDLIDQIRPKALLQSLSYVLDWDQETYMPKEGIFIRAEQAALVSELIHKEATSETLENLLSRYVDLSSGAPKKSFPPKETAILREVYRDYSQAIKLPTSLVKELKRVTTQGLHAWKEAKHKKDFSLFAPYLKEIVKLNQQKAKYLTYKNHPYDALLDAYEPKMTTKILDALFGDLKGKLISLTKKLSTAHSSPAHLFTCHIPAEEQLAFGNRLMKEMGMNPDTCRLDLTEHPFCLSFGPRDVRITTKVHLNSIIDTLSAVIHEAGHALYELGMSEEEFGNPLGEPASFAIHESQSRLWEVYVGQSAPFWQFYGPEFKKAFPNHFQTASWNDFYLAVNQVKPSLIRIFADEVTYSLHIILRYEIEKGLIDGSISVDDLPHIWKQKMDEYLGITPSHDGEGVLQDIHWSMGYFGYFPSYSLGSMYAAALWDKLGEVFPKRDEQIAAGDLLFIKDWLKEHIYSKGRLYPPLELIEKATGRPFNANSYIHYLETKYPLQ